jgi:murein L,D-transpeptidase YcbB/YkuD
VKVPVHVLYWTAWVDEGGRLQFRDDLYRIDARLARALERENATPV